MSTSSSQDSQVILLKRFDLAMQQILSLLVVVSVNKVIQSKPINNGLTLKFNPISVKEDVKPKPFGALFAKIPQEETHAADTRREILSKAYFSHSSELGAGCSNQIAKILFPFKAHNESDSKKNSLNIPIVQQPFDSYKIVVATAPSDVKISGPEAKPLVVYIVFPEDETSDANSVDIPSIYFVKKQTGFPNWRKKEKVDPILIINSNRTVTGLKSKEVAKFVKFTNKLTSRYNYEIERR